LNETIVVALVVSIISPTIVALLAGRQQRKAKEQDWAREDAVADKAVLVAKQASAAAQLLLAAQETEAVARQEVARLAAENNAATASQLKQIHTLVNSDMTAARQSELNTFRQLIESQKAQVKLISGHNLEAPTDLLESIKANEERVQELRAVLADRLRQQEVVEAEQVIAKEQLLKTKERE
jgi:hypothetical protein